MTHHRVDELTSCEAGFLFAARRCGRLDDAEPWVDEVAAPPLKELMANGELTDTQGVDQALKRARFEGWYRRCAGDLRSSRKTAIEASLRRVGAQKAARAGREAARRVLRRSVDEHGGDLSVWSRDGFNLRRWIDSDTAQPVATRLVILGGVLVGALARTAVRRRLAALMRDLPPSIRRQVHLQLRSLPTLQTPVLRRINEVYCRIAAGGYRPDEELALLGLFFVVSASILRQNRYLDRFQTMLPPAMARRCRKYRRACLRSGKPELIPVIADRLFALSTETKEEKR